MATAFVVNGGNVIIASRKEKALAETCDKLNALKTGGKASYVVADISTKAGCETVAEGVKKLTDKIHVLVANAGATWGGCGCCWPPLFSILALKPPIISVQRLSGERLVALLVS